MNASDLLRRIKTNLGIYSLKLPFDDPDKEIMENITSNTLKTFSVFLPHIVTEVIDLTNTERLIQKDYYESIYLIPPFFPTDIVYVRNVTPRSNLINGGFLSPMFDVGLDVHYSMMMANANANLISSKTPSMNFIFKPPNKLYLYNVLATATEMVLEVGFMHSPNLSTITPTSWETFVELAILDTKIFLYGVLKHYNDIQSAYGNINLKIDDWSNAEGERKDMVEKMRDTYHLEVEQMFMH
jgi:hypothetical protein